MSDVFVGQLLAAGFNFAPRGFAFAAGQLMPISQNTALFSLLGTYYGGDGKSTFALPNLQGNVSISAGQGPGLEDYFLGQQAGEQAITLLTTEMPQHSHTMQCYDVRGASGQVSNPGNTLLATTGGSTPPNVYLSGSANAALAFQAVGIGGGSQPHNNMMPYLGLNWIISLQGVFPARG